MTDARIARTGSRWRLVAVGGLLVVALLSAGSTRLTDGLLRTSLASAASVVPGSAVDDVYVVQPSQARHTAYRLFAARKPAQDAQAGDAQAGRRLSMITSVCETNRDVFSRRLVVCSVHASASWRIGVTKVGPLGRIR